MFKTDSIWWVLVLIGFTTCVSAQDDQAEGRVTSGLQLLYDFDSVEGDQVTDRSGTGEPLNLSIGNLSAVRRQTGSLEVRGATLIRSAKPATKIVNAVKLSGEITVEAWVRPSNATQEGPARILTISNDPSNRNFTIGQEKTALQVRLRTTSTTNNGMPASETSELESLTRTQHIVYVRSRDGSVRLYRDGRLIKEDRISGAMSNWNPQYPLGLANEMSGDRPFLGTYFLIAIYNKALNREQVIQNFKAGAEAKQDPKAALTAKSRALFDNEVAAIFAHSCLECHDSLNRAGELDLSRRDLAIKGGENGAVLVSGDVEKSSIWTLIESNEMPKERSPLRDTEKAAIKAWIESGAEWTTQRIDPALFVHEQDSGASWIRRLTLYEYIETVRSCFSIDIAKEAQEILPADLRADGFGNTAYNLTVDLKHIESYAALAAVAAEKIDVPVFLKRYTNSTSLREKQKREVMGRILKDLLRGPVTDREIDSFMGVVTSVSADGGDFVEGMEFVLQAVMQSPRFLYRMESQRGDGSQWPATAHELAVRMSYILWGAPPDKELYRAADAGELGDSESLLKQIERMLDDPRAERRAVQFAYEWLNLSRLDNLNPDKEHFPEWNPQLAEDMRLETLEFFREVAWKRNMPLSALLNSQYSFLTPALARHYGLDPNTNKVALYDLSEIEGRGGLLTQGSLLTIGGDEASMVARGLFVMQDLMRGVVQDPPPCVDTTPVPTKAGLTQRGIADGRLKNNACNGCHAKFEPLAFGLERFNGIGAWSTKDAFGNALREDGSVLIPGDGKAQSYKTSRELMDILAESERVKQTIAWKLTQYALGRPLSQRDAPTVESIYSQSEENGGTYRSLITAIVTSDLVQLILTESEQ